MLNKDPSAAGDKHYAYLSTDFQPSKYEALMIDPLRFYPEPQPSQYVTAETLNQLSSYFDQAVRTKIGRRVRLADQPGHGVAHVRLAITAVGEEARTLKPYQFIPVGLAITGVKAAVEGGLPHHARITVENEVRDSVSGQPLLLSVRGGGGQRITSDEQGGRVVTLNDLRPLLDKWTDAAAAEVTKYVKAM